MPKSELCTFCGAANAPHPFEWQRTVAWLCDGCYIKQCEAVLREVLDTAKWVAEITAYSFMTEPYLMRDLRWDVTVKLPDMIGNLHLPELKSTFEPEDLLDEGIPF